MMKYRIFYSALIAAFSSNIAWAGEAREAKHDIEIQNIKISKKINAQNIAANKAAIAALQLKTGPQGPAGPKGATGAQGPAGPKGATGAQGPAGPKGATGAQGPVGPKGATGAQGPAGPKGATGAQGPVGPKGATGAQGPAGPKGATGAQGPAGPKGATGAQGPVGPKGATGAQGPVGPKGATGAQGPVGPKGATGAQGPAGPKGATGAQGPVGPKGATGAQGPVGPKGATGAQGPRGLTGPVGPKGATGAQGPAGPKGPQGVAGPAGPKGDPGAPGAQGPQGTPGKDLTAKSIYDANGVRVATFAAYKDVNLLKQPVGITSQGYLLSTGRFFPHIGVTYYSQANCTGVAVMTFSNPAQRANKMIVADTITPDGTTYAPPYRAIDFTPTAPFTTAAMVTYLSLRSVYWQYNATTRLNTYTEKCINQTRATTFTVPTTSALASWYRSGGATITPATVAAHGISANAAPPFTVR